MLITAAVDNRFKSHRVTLSTGPGSHSLEIASRDSGWGSAANGGELLCLALATCYCNDIYREAAKRSLAVHRVEVRAQADFDAEGLPAKRLSYRATVWADAPEEAIRDLIEHTDRVAEVHNTVRLGMPVILETFTAKSVKGATQDH